MLALRPALDGVVLPIAVEPLALAVELDDFAGVLVLFVVGLVLVYDGFRKWQQLRLMQDTPTEKIRSAAAGRTEVAGTATASYGTIDRPFTDGECLVASYEIEEWHSDDDGGNWQTIDSGVLATPFDLDDGTGSMRVEPTPDATYEISEKYRTRIEVDGSEVEPPAIAAFLRERSSVDVQPGEGITGGLFESDRRYTQRIIPPGVKLYVLGGAFPRDVEDDASRERLVLGRDEASDEFIISDLTEDALVSSYRWRSPAEIVGGIVLSSVALYFILTMLGV